MKIAIIGSRDLTPMNIEKYIPDNVSEIVSGGARGVDTKAKEYAYEKGLKYVEFSPEYSKYGRFAPLKRNQDIVNYSDLILAFWDGKSKGTKFVIDYCKKINKTCTIINIK